MSPTQAEKLLLGRECWAGYGRDEAIQTGDLNLISPYAEGSGTLVKIDGKEALVRGWFEDSDDEEESWFPISDVLLEVEDDENGIWLDEALEALIAEHSFD